MIDQQIRRKMDQYTATVLKPKVNNLSKSLTEEDNRISKINFLANKSVDKFQSAKKREIENHYREIGAQVSQSGIK